LKRGGSNDVGPPANTSTETLGEPSDKAPDKALDKTSSGTSISRSARLSGVKSAGVAAGLGALQTWAYVETVLWPLPLLTVAALLWLLNRSGPGRAALLGWCYGTAWLCAGVWWLFISMHRYGDLPALLAVLAVLALSGFLSLYLAAACAAYAQWRRGTAFDVLLFAALWLLAELARGVIFTGFPWLAVGYSQVDSPLAALAPYVGVYGMGAVVALLAAGLVLRLDRAGHPQATGVHAAVPLVATMLTVLAAVLLPRDFTQAAGDISVALLQSNVKQNQKFDANHMPDALAWTGSQLRVAVADLVVAPETSVPLSLQQLDEFSPGYWQSLRSHFMQPGRAALVGVPLGGGALGYTNSVAGLTEMLSPSATDRYQYRYDKEHLVPFGEFIPSGFRWFTNLMNIPLGDFARGVKVPPSFTVGAQRVGPNICYEDLFGEELARRFNDPDKAPTVFANVSNIGWFGPSVIIAQHLHISRLRTLEFQRPMLRATNTGATAIINHEGQVSAQLAPYTRGVLHGRVQGRTGRTPYAWWAARASLWPLLGLALAVIAFSLAKGRGAAQAGV
jgi:apolipoprotein N-acyltransferase